MSAHTPGPWIETCSPENADYYERSVGVQAVGYVQSIADIYAMADAEMSKANTRLVAAAPEMLAALHAACGLLPTVEEARGEHQRRVITKMRAAIAKAEGK